jgi:hypothetical protein
MAILATVLLASSARADFGTNLIFDGQDNLMNIQNWEIILRPGAGLGVNNVTIGATTYSVIDPVTAGAATDDIVVQILNVTSFTHLGPPFAAGAPVGPPGEFTFYTVGKVLEDPAGPVGDDVVPLDPGDTDPFGIITPDSMTMSQWYVDASADMLANVNYVAGDASQGAALTRSVSFATDGTPWAAFGVGPAADASGYTGGGVEVTGFPGGTAFEVVGALNVLALQSLVGANFVDTGQIDVGPATSNTSVEFTQRVVRSGTTYSSTPGNTTRTPWHLRSTDPLHLAAVPEPGSLVAYAGLLIAGLGFAVGSRWRNGRG